MIADDCQSLWSPEQTADNTLSGGLGYRVPADLNQQKETERWLTL
jgi:hypothetical protein